MAWNLSDGLIKGMLGPTAPKGSLTDLFLNGTIHIYSGIPPANANSVETGTLLLKITLDGLPFVGGSATNGINFGAFVGLVLKQAVGEVWKGIGIVDGTAGWARWYANDYTTGASTTAVRMDGVVSTSGAEINMANGTTIAAGVASEVTDVSFQLNGI